MKRFIFLAILPLLLISVACNKNGDCVAKTVQSEEATMQAYAAANSMTVTRNSSGIYYEVLDPGTGATPDLNTRISVKYTGKLLNGTVFDQATTPTALYPLSGFIPGWQLGLPLIKKGGKINLIIPSVFAYGCKANGPIPANSILYFQVELIDVQ